MKRILHRLLIITIITLIADRALSYAVNYFYSTTTTTDEYKLNSVILRMNDPVIIMGSSRAHHSYIPSIISDSLHIGVYNAGLWGMRNIYFQYGLLNNILTRYSPRTILLEVHPTDYLATPFSDVEAAGVLAPFTGTSAGGDEIMKKTGYFYKDQVSHLYRYNSLFANLVVGNLTKRSLAADKGYKALNGTLDTAKGIIKPEKFPFGIDKEKVHYLQAFIDRCKEKNIQLIFLFSPMYSTENTGLFKIPNSVAKKNNIPFINHYNLPGITGHAEYFHDFGHLNNAGAIKYSHFISHQLKTYIY